MSADYNVAVVGNIGIDTNVYLYNADVDWRVEANFSENLDYVGQAGGYTSRGFVRLGKRTAFIGSVGNDYHGQLIRQTLAADGIDSSALFVDPAGTSRSVNIMYRNGRRKNFYDGKSHVQLRPDMTRSTQILARSRLALFHLPNWARELLPVARRQGCVIACDLQDVTMRDDPYRRDFVEHADILFCSATNFPNPADLVEPWLSERPDRVVVVGMGAQGCALGTASGIQVFPPAALDLPVIDTNGAGDALAVGFLTSYALEGRSLEESIKRGQIAARITCAQKASSANLITADQLEAFTHAI